MNEKIRMPALGGFIVAVSSLALMACAPGNKNEEVPSNLEAHSSHNSPNELDILAERELEYGRIFREARQQGLVSGALRGALVGVLVTGEGAGAAAGAFLGGIIGSNYSVVAAEKLLQEREEFLNRQAIVDNVLLAARNATAQTEQDAKIVEDAVERYSKYSALSDPAARMKISEATVTVSRAAELRALVITESAQEASISENEAQEIRLLLNRQMNALGRMREMQASWNSEADG